MEHAIPNTKFTDYDQVISVADSEIRRLLGTDEDIKTSINTLQTKIDLILKNRGAGNGKRVILRTNGY